MIRGYLVFAIGVVALLTIQPDYSIAAGVTQTYQYDSLGRLVGTWDTLNIHSQTTYDAASNRSTVAVTNEPLPPPADTGRLHVRQVRSPSTGKTITIVTP
jgi:YD repeat-containing protein